MAQSRVAVSSSWNLEGWDGTSRVSLTQRRVAARAIDLAITGMLTLVLASASGMVLARDDPESWGLWTFMIYPVLWTCLMFVSDAVGVGLYGSTMGKRLQAIRVIRVANGTVPGWRCALGRAYTEPLVFIAVVWAPLLLVRVVWPIFFVSTWLAWAISCLWSLASIRQLEGRSSRDKRAGTVVVFTPPRSP
ncbi:RDD family protein [Candidatus Poriferisodalis sp.]|uniref:RDD family protein n=1 Tax=Candidatus Poriferisodalis sp. TaxID=3101277 RepID=UPI003B012F22